MWMSLHGVALAVHVGAGSTGLMLGPIAALAAKRRGLHTRIGTYYYWAFVVLVISALVLAALDPAGLWGLAVIAIFSYAFALLGYLAATRRWDGWLIAHVSGQGGSYIAMTTALLVVNLGTASPLAWIAPTLVGSPLIAYANTQIARGRRPKGREDLGPAARGSGSSQSSQARPT
jgi:hypothetical protein